MPAAGVLIPTSSVLVVEPDEEDRTFFVSALASAGIEVIATDNFASARACLEAQAPTLLVSEMRLGSHSGLWLALFGRHISPGLALMMTSRCRLADLQRRGEELGVVFVQKPMTQDAFLAAVLHATLQVLVRNENQTPTGLRYQSTDEEYREIILANPELPEPRVRRRRRDIATFLFLEGLRR